MPVSLVYFQLGLQHILAIDSYDHILFVIALCVAYPLREWRQIFILVTAFTIGHTLTLALATLGLVNVNRQLIESLIPVTIFLTSAGNFVRISGSNSRIFYSGKYVLAMVFGLIHGLGFSNYLVLLLSPEENLILPLASFNIGVEVGQIFIVTVFCFITWLITVKQKLEHDFWCKFISAGITCTAFWLIIKPIIQE